MEEEKLDNIIHALSLIKENIITRDDVIYQDDLVYFENAHILSAFFKRYNDKTTIKYNFGHNCYNCGVRLVTSKITKQEILNIFNDKSKNRIYCKSCYDIFLKEEEEERKLRIEKAKIDREERERKETAIKITNTYNFINNYLIPNSSWKKEIKQWEKMNEIKGVCLLYDTETILQEINNMGYKNFLTTKYWKAISGEVKKRAKFKCQLCNYSGYDIQAHHKNYDILGKEIYNLDKLICLCVVCHSKHHDKIAQGE